MDSHAWYYSRKTGLNQLHRCFNRKSDQLKRYQIDKCEKFSYCTNLSKEIFIVLMKII